MPSMVKEAAYGLASKGRDFSPCGPYPGYLVLPHCDRATQPEVDCHSLRHAKHDALSALCEVIAGLCAALHTLRCLLMREVQVARRALVDMY
eukprot:198674-Amphidinium_carterae.2